MLVDAIFLDDVWSYKCRFDNQFMRPENVLYYIPDPLFYLYTYTQMPEIPDKFLGNGIYPSNVQENATSPDFDHSHFVENFNKMKL
jgi:hypothetical protein